MTLETLENIIRRTQVDCMRPPGAVPLVRLRFQPVEELTSVTIDKMLGDLSKWGFSRKRRAR